MFNSPSLDLIAHRVTALEAAVAASSGSLEKAITASSESMKERIILSDQLREEKVDTIYEFVKQLYDEIKGLRDDVKAVSKSQHGLAGALALAAFAIPVAVAAAVYFVQSK